MRTASSQRRATNLVISIVLALFLASAAGFTVVRAVILLGQLSPLVTQSRAERMHSPQIQP
jgi:hypothetical protein